MHDVRDLETSVNVALGDAVDSSTPTSAAAFVVVVKTQRSISRIH